MMVSLAGWLAGWLAGNSAAAPALIGELRAINADNDNLDAVSHMGTDCVTEPHG